MTQPTLAAFFKKPPPKKRPLEDDGAAEGSVDINDSSANAKQQPQQPSKKAAVAAPAAAAAAPKEQQDGAGTLRGRDMHSCSCSALAAPPPLQPFLHTYNTIHTPFGIPPHSQAPPPPPPLLPPPPPPPLRSPWSWRRTPCCSRWPAWTRAGARWCSRRRASPTSGGSSSSSRRRPTASRCARVRVRRSKAHGLRTIGSF
jgi:hypothetical protein